MLAAARGDNDSNGALAMVRVMHMRPGLADEDPELAEALAEGDLRFPDDQRRRPDDPEPWKTKVAVDPATAAAFERVRREGVITLDDAHKTFCRWLGDDYDTDSLDAMLCTLAAHHLGGDPLWLLIVSGSGNAKTETVQAAAGAGAIVTSTISSEGALLSGSPKRDQAKDATGGLLRRLGPGGALVIKDVTSILSMHRDLRAAVLAALREVYDGYWSRNLGVDGGRTLEWQGRLAVIGAVTTAWDRAHAVIASMGDRFVLLRTDSTVHRLASGRQAIANTGSEIQMRSELVEAVAGVMAGIDLSRPAAVSDDDADRLMVAANLVTLARTAVDYDHQGNVEDAHAPEMPTRFAKQLAQVVRGGLSLGMERAEAMRLAIRCARDSMPPMRLAIIDDLARYPRSSVKDVRRRIDKPRNSVDRQLQALHMLGVLTCDEAETPWRYSLVSDVDPKALVPDMSSPGLLALEKSLSPPCDKAGTDLLEQRRAEAYDGDEKW
jgi:hypothetical protein